MGITSIFLWRMVLNFLDLSKNMLTIAFCMPILLYRLFLFMDSSCSTYISMTRQMIFQIAEYPSSLTYLPQVSFVLVTFALGGLVDWLMSLWWFIGDALCLTEVDFVINVLHLRFLFDVSTLLWNVLASGVVFSLMSLMLFVFVCLTLFH